MNTPTKYPLRTVPDRREFLSDVGHALALAEERAKTNDRRRSLLVGAIVFASLGLSFVAALWIVRTP